MKDVRDSEGLGARARRGWQALKDFLYGFFLHRMVQEVVGRRRRDEGIFLLLVMGDLVGVPIFPNYYRLRLLPHCLAELKPWKRGILRPTDVLTIVED